MYFHAALTKAFRACVLPVLVIEPVRMVFPVEMQRIRDTPSMPLKPPKVSNLTNQLHGRDQSNASKALQNLNCLLKRLGLQQFPLTAWNLVDLLFHVHLLQIWRVLLVFEDQFLRQSDVL